MSRRLPYGEWVPFHASLCEGDKRGLSRATRFVYLELCLKARRGDGEIILPRGFRTDEDAIHDLVGGDRKELREAVKELSREAMISLTRVSDRSILKISAHDRVTGRDKSTPRVRAFRERQREELRTDEHPGNAFHGVSETLNETRLKRPTEQNRTKQTDPPLVPPPGGSQPGLILVCPGNAKNDDGVQAAKPKGRRRKPETECPPTEASVEDVDAWCSRWGIDQRATEFANFLNHHRAKGSRFRDWLAAWRKWEANGRRWGATANRSRVPVQGGDISNASWLPPGAKETA